MSASAIPMTGDDLLPVGSRRPSLGHGDTDYWPQLAAIRSGRLEKVIQAYCS